MKKKLTVLLLIAACLLVLAGCGCEHEWAEADCVTPKHCSLCEETEGEPLGHVWFAATCEAPKTCETCGATEGDPKGHSWVEASCEEAKHCETCSVTEGEALGHNWLDATTEAPKTCETCAATEGDRIITDPRFTTAATASLQGKWALTIPVTGEMMGIPDFPATLECSFILDFGNAGDLSFSFNIANQDAFMEAMVAYTIDEMYAEFATMGYNKDQTDAAMKEAYGMSTEDYVRKELSGTDFNALFDSIFSSVAPSGVYYVENGTLYVGDSWEATLEPSAFTLEGDTLYIESFAQEMGMEDALTRVTEE